MEDTQTQASWLLFFLLHIGCPLSFSQEEGYPTLHPKRTNYQEPLVIKLNVFKPQNTDFQERTGSHLNPALFQQSLPYQDRFRGLGKCLFPSTLL